MTPPFIIIFFHLPSVKFIPFMSYVRRDMEQSFHILTFQDTQLYCSLLYTVLAICYLDGRVLVYLILNISIFIAFIILVTLWYAFPSFAIIFLCGARRVLHFRKMQTTIDLYDDITIWYLLFFFFVPYWLLKFDLLPTGQSKLVFFKTACCRPKISILHRC